MANEQFSLCWDNFHSNMSNGLSSFLKTEDLVDVTLAAEGRYLKAHKMILSVCSPYFRELFQVNPCQHPIVFLKDVSFSALSNLLEFMYQGEVKVSQDDLGTFIKTAEALKIKGLTGDGPSQIEQERQATLTPIQNNISTSETTLNTRKTREKTPPPRKKMLGPASKRFKSDSEQQPSHDSPQQSLEMQKLDLEPTTATEPAPIKQLLSSLDPLSHVKTEPEETAVSLTNDEESNYDDSTMDEMGLDNTTDYIMDSSEMDVKAGTSSEVAIPETSGENQEIVQYIQGARGHLQVVIGDYLYIKNVKLGQRTHWKCALYDVRKCRARCTISDDGRIYKSKDHLHPPVLDKIKGRDVLSVMMLTKVKHW